MPGQTNYSNTNQRFYVTIPRGIQSGQSFSVLVNGQQIFVRCPPGSREGDRLIVTPPRTPPQQFVVTVPSGVQPGEQFRVSINNREVLVTCPPGVLPNERVTFNLPSSPCPGNNPPVPIPPCAAPNHQMFEVVVPDGIRPGQSFALVANGQRVMVTCPLNISSGQKIRFQLPIKLTKEQLESVRVDYQKDGWMRCLGSDLNFHWVYNTAKNTETNTRAMYCPIYHRKCCELNRYAFVRQLIPPICPKKGCAWDLQFIDASLYSMPSTVSGTKINYSELSSVALLSFQQKCDWLYKQFNLIRIPQEAGYIKLKLRRTHLLIDSMNAMESLSSNDMKKTFRIEFIGEPGLDYGGVSREWYELVTQELFNPALGLFRYSVTNQMCLDINHHSHLLNKNHLKYYYFIGRMLGKAVMDHHITPIHHIAPAYKYLLGYPIKLRDIESVDKQIYENLLELLTVDDVSLLDLDFTITEDGYGDCNGDGEGTSSGRGGGEGTSALPQTIPLIPNGHNIPVTNENLIEYLTAQTRYRLFTRIKSQLCEILRGFYEIVPEPFISVFNAQELELLLHGIPNIDITDWRNNTEYLGEFLPNHNAAHESHSNAHSNGHSNGHSDLHSTGNAHSNGHSNGQGTDQGIGNENLENDDMEIVNQESQSQSPQSQSSAPQWNHSHLIDWFWEIVTEFPNEDRAKLLQFSTGTSGVPPQGFGSLQSTDGNIRKFSLLCSSEIKVFPRSHTCFNRIDLPLYSTKEEMKKYLTLAITLESTGFELE
jgi:hypothetical protein